MLRPITINLARPPSERWEPLLAFREEASAMAESYVRDLGDPGLLDIIEDAAPAAMSSDQLAELRAISKALPLSLPKVLLANLYYDAFQWMIGCTAFACETQRGILHARNLDWWTERGLLRDLSLRTRFLNAPAGEFESVGWPGFTGVFSGVARGRFAITMNAVLSDEPTGTNLAIPFLIRQVFETARNYDEALEMLRDTAISSSCLLLLSGVRPGQLAVIERTPTRSAVRKPTNGFVVVTNDYRMLDGIQNTGESELAATSCGRFDRAMQKIAWRAPSTAEDALAILSDKQVKMLITVQHMVFRAADGECTLRLP